MLFFGDSGLGLLLLLLDRLQELVSVQLLDALGCLQVVIVPLLVGVFGLVLLPVEDFLPQNQFLVVLFDLLVELLVLRLHFLLKDFLCFLSHLVKSTVSFLSHLYLAIEVALIGIQTVGVLPFVLVDSVLHLMLVIELAHLLVLDNVLSLLTLMGILLPHVVDALSIDQLNFLNPFLSLLFLPLVQLSPLFLFLFTLDSDQFLLLLSAFLGLVYELLPVPFFLLEI